MTSSDSGSGRSGAAESAASTHGKQRAPRRQPHPTCAHCWRLARWIVIDDAGHHRVRTCAIHLHLTADGLLPNSVRVLAFSEEAVNAA